MSENINGLLLEDRWAPVTSNLGFLELDSERAARTFASWQAGLNAPHGVTVDVHPITGTLEQTFCSLLPLTGGERRRHLFIPTRGAWTAYVDNGWQGTDAASAMAYMARALGCRGLRVGVVPHTLRSERGRYGIIVLEIYGPRQATGLNTLRTLYVANDGGRWVFGQSGEPLSFEKPAHYQARKVRERFTFEMLQEYLLHLGVAPFQEDFYLPTGTAAWRVEKTGPVVSSYKEYSLVESRGHF